MRIPIIEFARKSTSKAIRKSIYQNKVLENFPCFETRFSKAILKLCSSPERHDLTPGHFLPHHSPQPRANMCLFLSWLHSWGDHGGTKKILSRDSWLCHIPKPTTSGRSSRAARHWQEQLETARENQCHQRWMLKAQTEHVPDYTAMSHGPCLPGRRKDIGQWPTAPRGSRNLSEQLPPSPPPRTLSPTFPSPGPLSPEGKLSLCPAPTPHSHHWVPSVPESRISNTYVSHHEEHHPWEIKDCVNRGGFLTKSTAGWRAKT